MKLCLYASYNSAYTSLQAHASLRCYTTRTYNTSNMAAVTLADRTDVTDNRCIRQQTNLWSLTI